MITIENVKDLLEDDLGIDVSDIDENSALFSSGIVDSFALVTVMMHLETTGGFRINPADVNLDNMDTIGRIVSFANRHVT